MSKKFKGIKNGSNDETFQCYYYPGGRSSNETPRVNPERSKSTSEVVMEEETISKCKWSLEEIVDLFEAMDKYGNYDYDNLAAAVKTKSKLEVKSYIERRLDVLRRTALSYKTNGEETPKSRVKGRGYDLKMENLVNLPNLELWRLIAQLQIRNENKNPDYSYVISDLFKIFADNEPEIDVSKNDVPDFKALYMFLAEVCKGNFPAELRPINACILSDALNHIMHFADSYSTGKEFLQNYMGTDYSEKNAETETHHNKSPADQYIEGPRNIKIRSNLNPLGIDPAISLDGYYKLTNFIAELGKTE